MMPVEFMGRNGESVDQIANVIARLKKDPNDRRAVVMATNPGAEKDMCLPPCHTDFQVKVFGDLLCLKASMRSADLFLGVPFNIASYALLANLFAQILNVRAGMLTLNMVDAHIYHTHLDAVEEQLGRQPYDMPTLEIAPEVNDIDNIRPDQIKLVNYQHHGRLVGTMASDYGYEAPKDPYANGFDFPES